MLGDRSPDDEGFEECSLCFLTDTTGVEFVAAWGVLVGLGRSADGVADVTGFCGEGGLSGWLVGVESVSCNNKIIV